MYTPQTVTSTRRNRRANRKRHGFPPIWDPADTRRRGCQPLYRLTGSLVSALSFAIVNETDAGVTINPRTHLHGNRSQSTRLANVNFDQSMLPQLIACG